MAAALSVSACAQEPFAPATKPTDKSSYTILHPTPDPLMRELSADRPDKTDCPFTVDAGHFQVEMDYVNYSWDSHGAPAGRKTESYQIAPMNLKAGLLNNLDFQLVLLPWQFVRTVEKSAGETETQSGFGDITPRLKINLIGNDGGRFALALIPFLKIPTAQDHLGNRAWEGGLAIPYAFDLRHWDVGFQTTFGAVRDDVGHQYHAEIANSVSIGHTLVGNLGYHVEFFSNVSTQRGTGWVGTFDTWLTYQVNKNLVIDAGVYIGVTKAATDWHPWIGMTKRF